MNTTMSTRRRWQIVGFCIVILIASGCLKTFYLGVERYPIGTIGTFIVYFDRTVWTFHPYAFLLWKDGDSIGGFYRIYDENGRKVFQLFSSSFNFDVILLRDNQVEIQSSKTYVWSANSPLKIED